MGYMIVNESVTVQDDVELQNTVEKVYLAETVKKRDQLWESQPFIIHDNRISVSVCLSTLMPQWTSDSNHNKAVCPRRATNTNSDCVSTS